MNTSKHNIYVPPPVAGYLPLVGNFCVATQTRPNWFHRTTMRLLLGWKWVPAVPPSTPEKAYAAYRDALLAKKAKA